MFCVDYHQPAALAKELYGSWEDGRITEIGTGRAADHRSGAVILPGAVIGRGVVVAAGADLWVAQTPQAFVAPVLREALGGDVSSASELFEKAAVPAGAWLGMVSFSPTKMLFGLWILDRFAA